MRSALREERGGASIVPMSRLSVGLRKVKVAIWIETEDGRGSLAIFEPFEGTFTADFNLADHITPDGWVEAKRIPGGRIEIEGTYRQVHTATLDRDPLALLEGR
jgi:hypothetical protein